MGGAGTLQNLMGEGGFESLGEVWGEGVKMLLKNTCEGVHLLEKLPAKAGKPANLLKVNFFTHIFEGF